MVTSMKSDCVAPFPLLTRTEYVPGALEGSVATIKVAVTDVIGSETNAPPAEPSEMVVCAVKLLPSTVTVGAGVLRPVTVAFEVESCLEAWDWARVVVAGPTAANANDTSRLNVGANRVFILLIGSY